MNGKAIIKFLVVIAVIIGTFAYCIQPLAGSLKQGLDLQVVRILYWKQKILRLVQLTMMQ